MDASPSRRVTNRLRPPLATSSKGLGWPSPATRRRGRVVRPLRPHRRRNRRHRARWRACEDADMATADLPGAPPAEPNHPQRVRRPRATHVVAKPRDLFLLDNATKGTPSRRLRRLNLRGPLDRSGGSRHTGRMNRTDRPDQLVSPAMPRFSSRRYLGVAQQLLLGIARGDFPVGSRIPSDRDLAKQEGVSRPTAREAVLVLELVGAVEIRLGDGVYVARPGIRLGARSNLPIDAPPLELIETRACIEPSVAALAALRMDRASMVALRDSLEQTASLAGDVDQLGEFVRRGLRFHVQLALACGNGITADITMQLVDVEDHPLWTLVNQQAMRTYEARANQLREHSAILDAVEARDAEGAAAAMRAHVQALQGEIFGPTSLSRTLIRPGQRKGPNG